MSPTVAQPSLLLEAFTGEELDRECLRRAVERGAVEIQRMECAIHQLRAKHARRLEHLAARTARARKPALTEDDHSQCGP